VPAAALPPFGNTSLPSTCRLAPDTPPPNHTYPLTSTQAPLLSLPPLYSNTATPHTHTHTPSPALSHLPQSRFHLTEATDSTWPVFKLFKKGGDVTKPLDWPAGKAVTADNLINWVVSETGAFIAAKVRAGAGACGGASGRVDSDHSGGHARRLCLVCHQLSGGGTCCCMH
jgi:hypothetical protein